MRYKKEIIQLLRENKFRELAVLSRSSGKVMTILISLTYDREDVIAWRAIEAAGLLTREASGTDPERARNTANRLLWMMRDESGGICWSAPEILGEIVAKNPVLCADFAPIIASFHDEKMFTAGVLWAVGTIGKINDEFTDYAGGIIIPCLSSTTGAVRAYAARASGILQVTAALHILEGLRNDPEAVPFYEARELRRITVGEISVLALAEFGKTLIRN